MKKLNYEDCRHCAFEGAYLNLTYDQYKDSEAMGGGMFTCCDCGLTVSDILKRKDAEIDDLIKMVINPHIE